MDGDADESAPTPLLPPRPDYEALRLARRALFLDALSVRRYVSASDWEERALLSEAGALVGARTVEAIWRSVWRM